MFAYVPARGGSQRIPRKNVRQLDGKPILGHVLETLTRLPFISAVHVSTDDDEIRTVAEAFGAECLELRLPSLADSKSGFTDLIRHDVPRYVEANGGDTEVLFVLATAALVPASVFIDAYSAYSEVRPDILMSCEPYQEPAWWALIEDEDGRWRPLFPEKVLINSQDLPPTITDAGLFYMFDQSVLKRFECHKTVNHLEPYFVPHQFRGDVNSEEDWERLVWKYERLRTGVRP